jgi:putative ABC transport system permease protein
VIVSPILLSGGIVGAGAARTAAVETAVAGVDFETLARLNPSWRLEGSWPRSSERACLVGASLAPVLAIRPGGEATLTIGAARQSLEVAGILSTGESEDDQLLVPLALLQEQLGLPGRISVAVLSVDGGAPAVARAAARIQDGIPGVSARPLWQVAAPQGALLGTLDTLMLFLTAVVLVLCGFSVATTLLSIVLERQEEIGLMRSLGAGDGEILTMFLAEVSLLAILGSAAGLALGAGAARVVGNRLFGAALSPRAVVIPVVLAISLLLCWSAVIVPLRRALAIQPAAALRGE